MRLLLRTHRYLSALTAPLMLFLAVSGGWQIFRLHEDKKDGSYKAPALLSALSDVHKAEHLRGPSGTAMRITMLAAALTFATAACLGIVMAIKLTRPQWVAWAMLAAGIIIPATLAIIAANAPRPAEPPDRRGPFEQRDSVPEH